MSVRWQHCIDHADKYSKAGRLTRLFSRRSSGADRQSVKAATSIHSRKNRLLLAIISNFTKSGGIKYSLMIAPRWFIVQPICDKIWSNCAFYDTSMKFGTRIEYTITQIFGYRAISAFALEGVGSHFKDGRQKPISSI